jgi:hypothetical protein
MYHQERLSDQLQMEFAPFGTLSVRVYFNHDCVFVEIIRAKNVLPLDNNGNTYFVMFSFCCVVALSFLPNLSLYWNGWCRQIWLLFYN